MFLIINCFPAKLFITLKFCLNITLDPDPNSMYFDPHNTGHTVLILEFALTNDDKKRRPRGRFWG